MTTTMNRAAVLAAMTKAVLANGRDFVYTRRTGATIGCFYSEADKSPSCIIGHVLHDLAPALYAQIASTEEADHRGVRAPQGAISRHLNVIAAHDPNPAEPDTALYWAMTNAQVAQDRGQPWGEVLDDFVSYLAVYPYNPKTV